ncbi:serine/threonine protein kinase [Gigaspora margarita]|uniref:Serine/threonine protein kinase n=1 Tax=Gigaspora margarita TaxID=4874 RepID=A0A8H4EJJ3_GIGMA|nr:serine/threonine protein kinase [Gigaspora margarita]
MGRHKEALSDINKSYGIKANSTNEAYLRFGACTNCKRFNTGFYYCHLCDTHINQKWTSGNSEIDNFIKNAQINSKYYHKIIEFIPYNKLENIKQIGKGGFGTVYSATWIDGKRIYDIRKKGFKFLEYLFGANSNNNSPLLSRKQCTVALKSLTGSFDEVKRNKLICISNK